MPRYYSLQLTQISDIDKLSTKSLLEHMSPSLNVSRSFYCNAAVLHPKFILEIIVLLYGRERERFFRNPLECHCCYEKEMKRKRTLGLSQCAYCGLNIQKMSSYGHQHNVSGQGHAFQFDQCYDMKIGFEKCGREIPHLICYQE